MASKRRYKVTDQPIYSDEFDRLRIQSPILNQNQRFSGNLRYMGDYNDPRFLKGLLYELKGDEEGDKTDDDGIKYPGLLKSIKQKIKGVETRSKRIRQQAVNKGKFPPKDMPQALIDKLRKYEAAEDVAREEIEYLENLLEKAENPKKILKESRILKHGPNGNAQQRDGVIYELAGQKVDVVDDVLIITDERSPYYGMRTADYFKHVSGPWNQARNIIDREKRKLLKKLHARGLREEFPERWKERRAELSQAHPEWKDLFRIKLEKRPPMPSWPEGVKNFLKEETEEAKA